MAFAMDYQLKMQPIASLYPKPIPYDVTSPIFQGLLLIRDYCVELQVKRDAEREKRITANKAEKAKILEDWKASKKMDQMRIAEIKAETGIRDKLRLEQIKEQRKYEKEEKMKKMRQQREMRKVQKEMEKDNMLMRKDIRERSSILSASAPALINAGRVEKPRRTSPRRKQQPM